MSRRIAIVAVFAARLMPIVCLLALACGLLSAGCGSGGSSKNPDPNVQVSFRVRWPKLFSDTTRAVGTADAPRLAKSVQIRIEGTGQNQGSAYVETFNRDGSSEEHTADLKTSGTVNLNGFGGPLGFRDGARVTVVVTFYSEINGGGAKVREVKAPGEGVPGVRINLDGKLTVQNSSSDLVFTVSPDQEILIDDSDTNTPQTQFAAKGTPLLFPLNIKKQLVIKGKSANGNGESLTVPAQAIEVTSVDGLTEGSQYKAAGGLLTFFQESEAVEVAATVDDATGPDAARRTVTGWIKVLPRVKVDQILPGTSATLSAVNDAFESQSPLLDAGATRQFTAIAKNVGDESSAVQWRVVRAMKKSKVASVSGQDVTADPVYSVNTLNRDTGLYIAPSPALITDDVSLEVTIEARSVLEDQDGSPGVTEPANQRETTVATTTFTVVPKITIGAIKVATVAANITPNVYFEGSAANIPTDTDPKDPVFVDGRVINMPASSSARPAQIKLTLTTNDGTPVVWSVDEADGGTFAPSPSQVNSGDPVIYTAPRRGGTVTLRATSVRSPIVSQSVTVKIQASNVAVEVK